MRERKVTLAESAGFCFGVERAVSKVYEAIEEGIHPIYTYGPIIHNEEVIRDMEEKAVRVVSDAKELASLEKGVVIIRSHGIGRAEHDRIKSIGFQVVDATCPYVLKIHRAVEKYSREGYQIVIVGNADHPEVKGIRGWVRGDEVCVVSSGEEIERMGDFNGRSVCVVAQTTFNYKKFQELVEIFEKKGYDIIVLNTICNATEERQTEARHIARESDAMIVIGDRHSSNTQKLFEICQNECANTYYIQTSKDMDYTLLESINNVGITAGASTPKNIIEEVSKNVRQHEL